MSELLINGCSYATSWSPLDQTLGTQLGYNKVTNISVVGSSNASIFRRTIGHILTNDVNMAILSLTFWDRQEAPWGEKSAWTDYGPNGILRPGEVENEKLYKDYINDRYRYDLKIQYIEKLLDNIILFCGWLDNQQIKYLIFSSPDNLFRDTVGLPEEKINYIRSNPYLINLENWSANQYIYKNGGKWDKNEENIDPGSRHYTAKSYTILNKFIINYLKQHDK